MMTMMEENSLDVEFRVNSKGVKFKRISKGKWRRVCKFQECTTYSRHSSYYCRKHKDEMDKEPEIKHIKIKDTIIQIKECIKYRLTPSNIWARVCSKDDCISYARNDDLCIKHYMDESGKRISEEETKKKQKETSSVGDSTEEYIVSLMKEEFEDANVVGNTGSTVDILFTDKNGVVRGIQVKTLGARNGTRHDVWIATFRRNKYPEDMLIVMVNRERTRFGIFFYGKCAKNSVSLPFAAKTSKYMEGMFTDIEEFKTELKKLAVLSTIVSDIKTTLCSNRKKEHDGYNNIIEYCKENGMKFEMNSASDGIYDIKINDKKLQMKVTSVSYWSLYRVNMSHSGRVKGVKRPIPYSEDDDIDGFVFHILVEKYRQDFMFVPKSYFLSTGHLSTNETCGKTSISIPCPDRVKDHVLMPFWNKLF